MYKESMVSLIETWTGNFLAKFKPAILAGHHCLFYIEWMVSQFLNIKLLIFQPPTKLNNICDLLSQNEHKVATPAIWYYYRFKLFIMQVLKWYMICGYSSLFCPAKIDILWWFSFVFYCSVSCLTGYISVYKLATLRSFCDSRSHISKLNVVPHQVHCTSITMTEFYARLVMCVDLTLCMKRDLQFPQIWGKTGASLNWIIKYTSHIQQQSTCTIMAISHRWQCPMDCVLDLTCFASTGWKNKTLFHQKMQNIHWLITLSLQTILDKSICLITFWMWLPWGMTRTFKINWFAYHL